MSLFDSWQHWGVDLDEVAFANAWAALGIAAAGGTRRDAPRIALAKALERSRKAEHQVPWTFPVPAGTKRLSAAIPLIANTTPQDWAQAWIDAVPLLADDDPSRPRIRIIAPPMEEPAQPWLRLLREAKPTPVAVSFKLTASRASYHPSWPLRLGILPGNSAEALIGHIRNATANEQVLALGREQANCDVLIHAGTTRTLLRELLDHPATIKANVVLLLGSEIADWGELSSRLASILAEARASGYLLLPYSGAADSLPGALASLIAELSHARPIDAACSRAFAAAFTGPHSIDLIAGFTDELAAFTLPKLAHTINRRIKAMPPGTTLDLSTLGMSHERLTRGVRGGGHRGAVLKQPAAASPARPVAARTVAIAPEELDFRHESEGATVLATMAEAIASAEVPQRAHAGRTARFLQQQSFVRRDGRFQPAANGLLANVPALVRVRIGPLQEQWSSLPTEFPVDQLPKDLERWTLTVWLSEPDHLQQPLKGRIRLPRDGASTECDFRFRPKLLPRFEARVTVLHRGRVIQTAVLRASVLSAPDDPGDHAPSLEDVIPVRQGLGELTERRQFDLAFVLNHGAGRRPLSTGLSENHAWISDLTKSIAIAKDINARLSPVAKSVADYADGLQGEKGRALLVQLARHGSWLHLHLVEEQLGATGNRPDIATKEYLQIVTTRSDAVIPFEFIYEYQTPDDAAKLCEHWKEGLKTGQCSVDCDRTSGKRVCPMGFWGIQKVIERHALTPELAQEGRELYLQSEPSRASDTLRLGGIGIFGASKRVEAATLAPLTAALNERTGVAPGQATDWDSWVTLVHDEHPNLLFALAHTDGNGANVSLELGGKTIKSIQIKRDHVRPDEANQKPLVALLGCDTHGTANDYGQHVAVFRARGAAIVIGTIATVFGAHAALVAKKLVDGLLGANGAPPQRLGEALRTLKREALLDNLLMPLCLVAYGDADWKLTK